MSTSTTAVQPSPGVATTPQFWERLWRSAGLQSAGLFIVAYFVYGDQPHVGASADALVAFYQGDRLRILIAAVLGGFAVLNLMWFAAAVRSTLAEAGQDGWGAAATAASAALGGPLVLLITVSAALAYSIARAGNPALLGGLNDLSWAGVVLSSFPRAMLIMSAAFGLWPGRADLKWTVHDRRCGCGSRFDGRDNLGKWRILGSGRSLFPISLPANRPSLDRGRQPGASDPQSFNARRMVMTIGSGAPAMSQSIRPETRSVEGLFIRYDRIEPRDAHAL